MDCQNFLSEAQRFLKHVQDPNNNRIDVGLHGRQAKWSLEFAKDPLGVEQPVLVGKYTLQVVRVNKNNPVDDVGTSSQTKHSSEDEDEEIDPNAAPTSTAAACVSSSASSSIIHLNITLFISYNQPYDVPSLDFIATRSDTGRPVNDVDELRNDFLGMREKLLDAFAIDAENAAALMEAEERMNRSNDDDEEDKSKTSTSTSTSTSTTYRNRILQGAAAPRISRTIHEVLNIPVFCIHACDTISHFKMMKIAKMMQRRDFSSNETRQQQEISQSPIDVVLALYGKFIGLE